MAKFPDGAVDISTFRRSSLRPQTSRSVVPLGPSKVALRVMRDCGEMEMDGRKIVPNLG